MRKFKYFFDLDKEEKWLESMAKQGYHLDDASFSYKFHSGKSENAIIKIDYRRFKKQVDFIDYCTMFEDSGWEHIAGKKGSGMQYFKKISEDSQEDIFSDNVSKAGKYKRYSDMFMELAICYFLFLVFLTTDIINVDAFIHPKELYFTPGLWEKTGISFWGSFLFETPFALIRGFSWVFILVAMLLFCYFSHKADKHYKKVKNSVN